AALADVGAVAGQCLQYLVRHPPDALRRRLHGTTAIAMSLGENVDEALAVERQGHRPAYLWIVEWRCITVHDQVGALVCREQFTGRLRRLFLYIFHQRRSDTERERQIELAGDET